MEAEIEDSRAGKINRKSTISGLAILRKAVNAAAIERTTFNVVGKIESKTLSANCGIHSSGGGCWFESCIDFISLSFRVVWLYFTLLSRLVIYIFQQFCAKSKMQAEFPDHKPLACE